LTAFAPNCLAGRHVLVTGASSGIGRAAAQHLAAHGARLSLVARNLERLDAVRIGLPGNDHSIHQIDLEGADSTADAIAEIVKDRGAFDGAFYSAGATLVLPIRLLFGAGVYGAFGMVRALSKKGAMTDGGSIVVMSSAAALRGRPALGAYCAAKAAVDAMVRCAALELAGRKIRVNSLRAAAVETPLHHDYMASIGPEATRDYDERHPLGYGQPVDVANAVLFLLSDASPWISGTNWAVDGAAAAK
jgi:NAD(P)-dependent dehydrogenase (short-subunit alcohol dehydrogenase family)